MRFKRIHRLKDYRIFREFNWPTTGLPDFARFNVIYGWNASGKTSLSNIFRHVQRREPISDGEVELVVDERRVKGDALADVVLPNVKVFNRDAINLNVFESPEHQLPAVYVFGEDSVEKQKQIEQLKQLANAEQGALAECERKKGAAEAALETYCTDQARTIKNLLTVAGGGPYNNYDARNLKATIQRLSGEGGQALSVGYREKCLSTKDGKSLAKIPVLHSSYPDLPDLTTRVNKLLDTKVLSQVLQELTESPEVSSWVATGLELHTGEHLSDTCRFCAQSLPPSRLNKIEAHFNDEFKNFQRDIGLLVQELERVQAFLKDAKLPEKNALYPHLQAEFEKAAGALKQNSYIVLNYVDALLKAARAKRDEPFKSVDPSPYLLSGTTQGESQGILVTIFQALLVGGAVVTMTVAKSAYDRIGQLVGAHNAHTENFDKEVARSRAALEADEVLKVLPGWTERQQAVKVASDNLDAVKGKLLKTREIVVELETKVLQHRRPAEELNQEMADYLGRDELRFEVEKTGYRISRYGFPAAHLSEGERTAIAFMYFLKSLSATDFDLKEGIVVIDDPVSSLDTNSLYSAFGYMKDRTADVGQLIILTHNFTFFRLVRNWFYNMPGQRKKDWANRPARFYMLDVDFLDGQRCAKIGLLDSFLHQYESEYHYLFKRVYEGAQQPDGQGLERYYAMPNIARRFLESFLAFRFPDIAGDLYHKLEAVQFDAAKKTRILRFMHTYSHFDQVAEPAHDPSILLEAPAVLRDVLGLASEIDKEHHDRMTATIASLPGAE